MTQASFLFLDRRPNKFGYTGWIIGSRENRRKREKFDSPDLDKKLYLALLEMNGEFPDIMTVESESE